ncbi:MAG: heavy metal translocating P-type ATPase [Gemmatimonadaceae bacterium]|nr:heavy metal translocating P-type ATPase [Gemmatimonadaceae bacterium]
MSRPTIIAALAAVTMLAGGAARATGHGSQVNRVWIVALILLGAPIVWKMLVAARHGRFATDLVAAAALIAAILLREPLPGLVIVLMQTGGEALERYAEGRASAAVRELEAAFPRHARRVRDFGTEDIDANAVLVGDTLLLRPGELVPCDGIVVGGFSDVDTSSLTGEPVPIAASSDVRLLSGYLNGSGSLTMRATAIAGASQYARIVELVRSAQATKSPLQRVAERYAVWFTPLTALACAATYYASGDWTRVLAVLVVATPCPLILAPPVAIVAGINRAARCQIIVRNGAALEQLGSITTAVFDKTGTLSVGRPALQRMDAVDGLPAGDALRFAAALEQSSSHPLARVVVLAAAQGAATLPVPSEVVESAGQGITGMVDGRRVHVGSGKYVGAGAPADAMTMRAAREADPGLTSFVAIDGRLVGVMHFADTLRPDVGALLARLARRGVRRTILLSGDHDATTRAVAERVGIAEVRGDLLPEDKVAAVKQLVRDGEVVLMVGDGTNDAPALSAAHVGIALAGHGGGITSEAADVIILSDELERVGDAIAIARRTTRVARQSIWAGLGMSGIAMIFAGVGMIPPAAGAVLQEAIDVAVILNALRASR